MHDGSFKSVTDQCDFIKQSFSSKKCQQYHDCCNSFCTVRMKCLACKVCLAPVLQLYKDLFIRRDEKIINFEVCFSVVVERKSNSVLLILVNMQVCVIMYEADVLSCICKCTCMQLTCESLNDTEWNWLRQDCQSEICDAAFIVQLQVKV